MIEEILFRMQENSNSTAGTDPRRQLATLKFQRAAGKLYEDLIRATHDAHDKQSNEVSIQLHPICAFSDKPRNGLMSKSK
jgi:hypothetical protein